MKRFLQSALFVLALMSLSSLRSPSLSPPDSRLQTLIGAWHRVADGNEEVVLVQDGYIVHTVFNREGRKFLYTVGGPYQQKGDGTYDVLVEFHTADSTFVGQQVTLQADLGGAEMSTSINGGEAVTWKRLDAGGAPLSGVWRISGRMQEGKVAPVQQSGPRKTLKVLTGGRFQWIAINPEVKGFYGTGGGRYTFENGTYTEHIEFFSRDSSRVGASLRFNGKLEGGAWHHSGNSSSGQPIYEVWSRMR